MSISCCLVVNIAFHCYILYLFTSNRLCPFVSHTHSLIHSPLLNPFSASLLALPWLLVSSIMIFFQAASEKLGHQKRFHWRHVIKAWSHTQSEQVPSFFSPTLPAFHDAITFLWGKKALNRPITWTCVLNCLKHNFCHLPSSLAAIHFLLPVVNLLCFSGFIQASAPQRISNLYFLSYHHSNGLAH